MTQADMELEKIVDENEISVSIGGIKKTVQLLKE